MGTTVATGEGLIIVTGTGMQTRYRLGVDIGGTFTDFVAYDEVGRTLKVWKNLSTPHNPI